MPRFREIGLVSLLLEAVLMLRSSPRIRSLDWGSVILDDGSRFKDAKLFPGGAVEWDWSETGTHHAPGIQPADVSQLLARGATTVVLSRGQLGRLQVMPETLRTLEDEGIDVRVEETHEAVRLYNELRETTPVGALIHSTC